MPFSEMNQGTTVATRPLTIGMVVYHYDSRSGGAQMQARKQVGRLTSLGHQVRIVTWRFDELLPAVETGPGWKIVRISPLRWRGRPLLGRLGFPIGGLRMLAALVIEGRHCDVLHVHQMLRESFVGCLAGSLIGRPTIVKAACEARWPDGDLPIMRRGQVYRPFSRQMLEYVRHAAAAVVAPGRAMVAELREAGFPRVEYIPNGTDLRDVPDREEARLRVRARLAIAEDQKIVLFVGRLTSQKGADILIRNWPKVRQAVPGAMLVIAGDGPDFGVLAEQSTPMAESIRFCRNQIDGQLFLAAADVVAVPSRAEGMSNVLLEAMAGGSPCVATAASGSPDLIEDYVNGIVVPIGAETDFANGVAWLLQNPERAAIIGERARQTVADGFTIDSVVDRYVELYRQVRSSQPLTAGRKGSWIRPGRTTQW
jgi:glycosyltransferase involved in cell wall biosynthesis